MVDTAEPGATVAEDAGAATTFEQGGAITREQFEGLRKDYTRLSNQRQRLIDRIDDWEGERRDYQRQIDLLNYLGIAIVVVFVNNTIETSSHTSVWVANKFLRSPEIAAFIEREVPR